MKEVVNRRYSRMLQESPDDLPQLVVIDGGKGQLDFAYQAICELGLQDRIFLIGLAKRLEEVIRIGDRFPLFIDRNSQALKLLQRLRDEAHRFGITFHRQKRSNAFIKSELEQIDGIGAKSLNALLKHFKTVANVRAASIEELAEVVGLARAKSIVNYFNQNE